MADATSGGNQVSTGQEVTHSPAKHGELWSNGRRRQIKGINTASPRIPVNGVYPPLFGVCSPVSGICPPNLGVCETLPLLPPQPPLPLPTPILPAMQYALVPQAQNSEVPTPVPGGSLPQLIVPFSGPRGPSPPYTPSQTSSHPAPRTALIKGTTFYYY